MELSGHPRSFPGGAYSGPELGEAPWSAKLHGASAALSGGVRSFTQLSGVPSALFCTPQSSPKASWNMRELSGARRIAQ
eukprot:12980281-Alexandrium_andersonii.AAC.1